MLLGVVPTPLVPLFMLHEKADCGIMITASHNPNDQNGIKLFSSFHGMKPLPLDDLQLSKYVYAKSILQLIISPLKESLRNVGIKLLNFLEDLPCHPKIRGSISQ